MPRFSFQVSKGKFSDTCTETACESNADARHEAMAIFADLVRDILVELTVDPIWKIEVADEAEKPIFRLWLLAESLDQRSPNTTTWSRHSRRIEPIRRS